MRLDEYLQDVGIPITKFARRIGTSPATIHNILDSKRDLRLSVAVRIEIATKGQVTCKEILPKRFLDTKDHKSEKKHKNDKKNRTNKNTEAKI